MAAVSHGVPSIVAPSLRVEATTELWPFTTHAVALPE